jgi:uncharacterized protein
MNLIRLLAIAALIWIVYGLVRRYLNKSATTLKKDPVRPIESMVRCEQCGLHIPAAEAVRDGNHTFCSPGHRDAHRARADT